MRNLHLTLNQRSVVLVSTGFTEVGKRGVIARLLCRLLECDPDDEARRTPSEERVLTSFHTWFDRVTSCDPVTFMHPGGSLPTFVYLNLNTDRGLVLIPTDGFGETHTSDLHVGDELAADGFKFD